MSERTEAELRRILGSSRSSVAASAALAKGRMRAPGREVPPQPSPMFPGQAGDGADDGDLLAVCVLWSPAWDAAALRRLCASTGDRRLFAVEPVPGLGAARAAQWATTRWWQRSLGHDFNTDVPVRLRNAGFQIFTIDRFVTDRVGLQTYAYLELGPRTADTITTR